MFSAKRDAADYDTEAETQTVVQDDTLARERFGGLNFGAAFFGWLVAMAVAILLTSIAGAIAAAVGNSAHLTQNQVLLETGTYGLPAAVVLFVILLLGYYTGGYVAGRMSRFNGPRQGAGTWVIGLVITILAVVLGAIFGSQYNLLDRVSLPRIPVPTDHVTASEVVVAVVLLVGTLLAAMAGGAAGRRYHARVDRAVDAAVA